MSETNMANRIIWRKLKYEEKASMTKQVFCISKGLKGWMNESSEANIEGRKQSCALSKLHFFPLCCILLWITYSARLIHSTLLKTNCEWLQDKNVFLLDCVCFSQIPVFLTFYYKENDSWALIYYFKSRFVRLKLLMAEKLTLLCPIHGLDEHLPLTFDI